MTSSSTSLPSPTSSTPKPASSAASELHEQLDQLTTAIQAVGDQIHTCSTTSEAHDVLVRARDADEASRTASVQEQLARMLQMTQESLRRNREERGVVGGDGLQAFKKDLQTAAFGEGGSAETASRSSMLESRESDA